MRGLRLLSVAKGKLIVLVVAMGALSGGASSCFAQQSNSEAFAIRVESHEVLIPVMVIDKSYFGKSDNRMGPVYGKGITGLSAKDFQVLEDGVEQRLQNVATEPFRSWGIVDNLSAHIESSCTPRGIWAGADAPRKNPLKIDDVEQGDFYLVSYVPPPSREGSCHHVQVKVRDLPKADVWARGEYCNTINPSSDPLHGSEIGKQMAAFANSTQKEKFLVSAQAVSFSGIPGADHVEIALEFPNGSFENFETGVVSERRPERNAAMAILGMVYGKDGILAARFSDSACYSPKFFTDFPTSSPVPSEITSYFEFLLSLIRYQTQIDLPPGDYSLKFVVTDGKRFGRAQVPLTVDSYQQNSLAISGIVLCKRFNKMLDGRAKELRAPQYVPLVAKGMEFTPAGNTHFGQNDPLISYLEVYEPLLSGTIPVKVQLEMKITNTKSGKLEVDTGLRSVDSDIQTGNPVIPVAWDLAVNKLRYGTYRLEVQASDSTGNKTPWRAVSFAVE
jgi:hypothetical protein